MNTDNPYESPRQDSGGSASTRLFKGIGTAILVIGLVILAYGATGFWLINTLPPNGGASGRLPSLHVMGFGVAAAVVGLVVRDLRIRRSQNANGSTKGIPTAYGIAVLVAILILFILAVSRL